MMMKEESDADPSAKVYAGCLVVHAPAQVTQWTFPFGGWGTYFTKGALERLILPLHCDDNNNSSSSSSSNNTTSDYLLPSTASFRHGACSRLVAGDDLLSEAKFYKPGMTIADILGAQASVKEKPYCLHSDWSIGYYVNFYNISGIRWRGPESHISWYPDAPQTRLHPLSKDSFIYRNKGGNCELRGDKCTANSMACHYMNETQMQHVYNLQSRVVNHNDGVNSRVLQHKKSPMLLSDTVSWSGIWRKKKVHSSVDNYTQVHSNRVLSWQGWPFKLIEFEFQLHISWNSINEIQSFLCGTSLFSPCNPTTIKKTIAGYSTFSIHQDSPERLFLYLPSFSCLS